MSQRDGFASGFLAGAIFGGVVGGVVGALIASRQDNQLPPDEEPKLSSGGKDTKPAKTTAKRRQFQPSEAESIEMARRSLEDKIAQLNETIDEVRQQIGNVNGNSTPTSSDQSFSRES